MVEILLKGLQKQQQAQVIVLELRWEQGMMLLHRSYEQCNRSYAIVSGVRKEGSLHRLED